MNKYRIGIIELILFFLLLGCNKVVAKGEAALKNGKITVKTAPHNVVKFKKIDNIDLSSVSYITSEKERDVKLETALVKLFHLKPGEDKFRYYYNKIDLNGDNKPELFVYLVGPLFSGSGGSSAIIFKLKDNEYIPLSKFTLVHNPIIISKNSTNGWKNIIMYVSGGGADSGYVEIKFNGSSYPSNPSIQPKVKNGTKVSGTAIISDDIAVVPGIQFN